MGRHFQLTSFHLKLVAMAFMVVDHFGVMVLGPYFGTGSAAYLIARIFGRIAFPLFAFMVVEAVQYTRNFKNYFLRLTAMAGVMGFSMFVLTEYFSIAIPAGNIFIELALGALLIYSLNHADYRRFLFFIPLLYLPVANRLNLPNYLQPDYGDYGLLLMLGFYFAKRLSVSYSLPSWIPRNLSSGQVGALALLIVHAVWLLLVALFTDAGFAGMGIQALAILAAPFLYFYRGTLGYHARWFKIFSYAFYPLHFIILYIMYLVVGWIL